MNRLQSKLHHAPHFFWTLAELNVNRLRRKMRLAPAPQTYSLAVTFRCNSKCAACGIWKTRPESEIGKEHYARFFQDKLVRKARSLSLTGGEPTLRSDLIEIMHSAYDACPNILLIIGTNCIQDDKVIEIIETFKHRRLNVVVSLDGLGSLHDEVRGVKGNFDKVMSVINHAKTLERRGFGPTLSANITVSMLNINGIPELTNHLKKLDVPFQLDPWVANEYYCVRHVAGSALDFKTPDARKRACDLFVMYDNPVYESFIRYWRGEEYAKAPCYILTSGVVWVRPNGDIPVCLKCYNQYPLGNIASEPFNKIWRSKRVKELRWRLYNCKACALDHPNMCDALNNYAFHGWTYRDSILQHSHSRVAKGLVKTLLR